MNKQQLTIEHLAPYLPYMVQMYWEDFKGDKLPSYTLKPEDIRQVLEFQNKPILRPLSDLTKEIEHNGEKFVPIKELSKIDGEFYLEYDENIYLRDLSNLNLFEVTRGLTLINKLFEWHFDVFKLIGTHAINLNELQK